MYREQAPAQVAGGSVTTGGAGSAPLRLGYKNVLPPAACTFPFLWRRVAYASWQLRTAAPPSVADARRTATGTPAGSGWTRRAASRALQTGKRQGSLRGRGSTGDLAKHRETF